MAKVLVIGAGGREHAICQQFLKSKQVTDVYCAPGNPGMLHDGIQTVAIDEMDFPGLIQFAQHQAIDLTFVGPEVPLSAGIVDAFQAQRLPIFGPTQAAAQLESSKSFAKAFMRKYHIPTADYAVFTDLDAALTYCRKQTFPLVIKVDGLAAGKGVTIADTFMAARDLLTALYQADAQQQVVIESYLIGQEFSFMCFVHDDNLVPLPLSQDHKRLLDGDKGPNTGGMGAYSPLPQMPDDLSERALNEVIRPTIAGMKAEGQPITGTIYAGLMLTTTGIKVIEYNMRLGDPETQVLLPQLKSDFYILIHELLAGHQPVIQWTAAGYTLGVVVAASGYPKKPMAAIPLPKLTDLPADITVTYAGVQAQNGQLVSHGGRVLMFTTTQKDIQTCRQHLYASLKEKIKAPFIYRNDIGAKALTSISE
ncbi:phosphoribosylamine--glycine ligase [Agrilactobacillus fermenti]|uniref:phosphoribosylamine--glycine ligase n=1 Tax=Agrilactobacillus fermenti TaxID=2586909 RepID=UPI001E652CAA|nr:phosphoribosylamine--glycine ligase [Agrilactobacillus fermenti]MCD2255898.1 phosphoribosylamine--glycine ligase [Agrilactobacillus fermenti]